MIITEDAQRETLLAAGKRLREVLDMVAERIATGTTAKELDTYAHGIITEQGDTPSFFEYQPMGVTKKYPAALCVSVNDEVVHGVPKEDDSAERRGYSVY